MIESYRDLIVWQKAMDVATQIYVLVKKLPNEEKFALSTQMRRAAISIPSNIAEGQARQSSKEFLHFLSISVGSARELETQLLLCVKVNYLTEADIKKTMDDLAEVCKMITAIRKKLK